MAAIVRPAGEGDVEAAAALLHTFMNPRIPPERWRRILDYPWRPEGAERGWLVEEDGRVVGFMATVYSDRQTAAGPRRFCDLGSWYLLREHRGSRVGDALLQAGMARPGVTYATMTARAATGRKIRALGFDVLDHSRSLFRPRGAGRSALAVEPADAAALAALGPREARILADHQGLGLAHVVVRDGEEAAHLVYHVKLKGEAVAYHEILHASDPAFLARRAQDVADALVRGERGVLAIDSRFMGGAPERGEVEPLKLSRWYRSADVAPAEIDHLYSEIVLLDLKLP